MDGGSDGTDCKGEASVSKIWYPSELANPMLLRYLSSSRISISHIVYQKSKNQDLRFGRPVEWVIVQVRRTRARVAVPSRNGQKSERLPWAHTKNCGADKEDIVGRVSTIELSYLCEAFLGCLSHTHTSTPGHPAVP